MLEGGGEGGISTGKYDNWLSGEGEGGPEGGKGVSLGSIFGLTAYYFIGKSIQS